MESITFEQLPKAIGLLLIEVDQIKKLIQQNQQSLLMEPEPPMAVQEAAKFLKLAVPTVYTLTSQQVLPHSKKGKRLYFNKAELMEWIQSGRKKTASEIGLENPALLLNKKKKV